MTECMTPWWAETERDPIHLAAADWLVRLRNPEVSLDETLAWQAWMREDIRNAQAFARVEAASDLIAQLDIPREASVRELARDDYDASVALKEYQPPARRFRPLAIAAVLVLLTMGLPTVLYFTLGRAQSAALPYVVSTAVGENRTVFLRDGSKVTLGGDTRISAALSATARDIELSHGEALFSVAKDSQRPFKVHAGEATIVALGTQFNVRRSSDRAVVSVTEGRVRIEPTAHILPIALLQQFKPAMRPVRLSAGQKATARSDGVEPVQKVDYPSSATSWQSGQLAFRMEPLRYVLEDVNRYAEKPLVLEDDSVGSAVITGMVSRQNLRGWVQSLERTFSLDAVEEPDRIVLKRSPRGQ